MDEAESVAKNVISGWSRKFLLLGQYPETLSPSTWGITYSRGLVVV